MLETLEEIWEDIAEFPNYRISNIGRVYNCARDLIMSTSFTPFGHLKITLKGEDGHRHTRGVAQLVAESFVESPDLLCDHVAILDGDFSNVAAYNLVWRPQWFVWRYTRQLKIHQPIYYKNLRILNLVTGVEYGCVIEAGMSEGLLFGDIWRSTYTGLELYPTRSIFEVIKQDNV